MSDSIKVIVRVRPFNSNEAGQSNIVSMDGQQVRLRVPDSDEPKKFAFHRCYWSTDDTRGKPAVDNDFVFNDIGKEVLEHIYQGYNSTIFAYGQTGAGKSYSIEGYEERGLLQMCLQDIFQRKEQIESEANGMAVSVKVTYLEIYNEKFRDLLDPRIDKEIAIQSAGNAVFIKGVDPVHCNNFDEVERLWKDGKKIRVIGSHAMNKTSSRSHAVFTIYYTETGKGKSMKSKFNIVDLAGSERQSKTGATGVRLQEANNINKSLTNLGIVIEALAKNCEKKTKDAFVPYRNSLLTHMLSESLAGNSKTFMIAAISPAESNYEETLSTLRFAQRASLISTQTKKNVESKEGYNKELLEEIERLKKQLEESQGAVKNIHTHSHSVDVQYITLENENKAKLLEERMAKMIAELQLNKSNMENLEKELEEERRKKAEMEQNRAKALKEAGLSAETQVKPEELKLPYIMNISEDPTLAGMLIYHLKEGDTSIGTNEAENDIKLNSLGINRKHCVICHEKGEVVLIPRSEAKLFVNGQLITEKVKLKHLDRIVLGHANTFKLIIPGQNSKDDLRQSLAFAGRYGEFLDDRLSANTPEAKSTKVFLQELEQRLGKSEFSKFLEKFKAFYNDVDEANDITSFRYRKFPLSSRNLHFRINIVIDIENYMKGVPEVIILCENRSSREVQFVWSEEKFQARLADMQDWYADVGGNRSESTFFEFDPWFDASDKFIKEKEQLEVLNTQELHLFWERKQTENNEEYKAMVQHQRQLLQSLKGRQVTEDDAENYADCYYRGYEVSDKVKSRCEKLNQDEEIANHCREFMEICAQIEQCRMNNKMFTEMKRKYDSKGPQSSGNDQILTEEKKKSRVLHEQVDEISMQNAWLNQKIEELEYELKKKTHELYKHRNK